jgi:hypothetical protein
MKDFQKRLTANAEDFDSIIIDIKNQVLLAESERDDLHRLAVKLKPIISQLYAERGEDELTAKLCTNALDILKNI